MGLSGMPVVRIAGGEGVTKLDVGRDRRVTAVEPWLRANLGLLLINLIFLQNF